MDYIKQFIEVIFYITVTIGIFVLAYFSTRFIAKKSMGLQSNNNLKLIEKIPLGKEKEAAIIKVGEDYYLAGISSGSVNFTGPLSETTKKSIVISKDIDIEFKKFDILNFNSYKVQAITVKLSLYIKRIINYLKGKRENPYE